MDSLNHDLFDTLPDQLIQVGDRICVFGQSGQIFLMDPEKRQIVWKIHFRQYLARDTVIHNGKMYLVKEESRPDHQSKIYGIDLTDGHISMEFQMEGKISDIQRFHNTLFFTFNKQVVSVDCDGKNFKNYDLNIPVAGGLTIVGNELYFTSEKEVLYKYLICDSATGGAGAAEQTGGRWDICQN